MASAKAWRHLGLNPPARPAPPPDLFDGENLDG
jgi:Holliday junction DNA helicase RuvB